MFNNKDVNIRSYDNLSLEVLYDINNYTKYVVDEKELKETIEKNDEYLINISHELKTPLNVIYSAAQLIEMYMKSQTENSKERIIFSLNSIKQNYFRLTKLTNNIIDIAKIEAGQFNLNLICVNIVEIIENIVDKITNIVKRKQLRIVFDTNVEEKMIVCDADNIERVFLNLISNAVKFSEPGGVIYININVKKEKTEIIVKDNGIGISKENISVIFQRHGQVDKTLSRSAEGSGLGLYLSKAIVELHGGSLKVDSKLNEGSSFTIVLPTKAKDSIYNIFINDKILNYDDKDEMINIEFSDIINIMAG